MEQVLQKLSDSKKTSQASKHGQIDSIREKDMRHILLLNLGFHHHSFCRLNTCLLVLQVVM